MFVSGSSEHVSIAPELIYYFEVRRHLCTMHYVHERQAEFTGSLTRIEQKLAPFGFVRVHRSYLVNCLAIERFNAQSVTLITGTTLPVGRRRYAGLCSTMERRGIS